MHSVHSERSSSPCRNFAPSGVEEIVYYQKFRIRYVALSLSASRASRTIISCGIGVNLCLLSPPTAPRTVASNNKFNEYLSDVKDFDSVLCNVASSTLTTSLNFCCIVDGIFIWARRASQLFKRDDNKHDSQSRLRIRRSACDSHFSVYFIFSLSHHRAKFRVLFGSAFRHYTSGHMHCLDAWLVASRINSSA